MYAIIYQERKSSISLYSKNNKWILNVFPNKHYLKNITMHCDTEKQIRLTFSTYENAIRFAKTQNINVIPCISSTNVENRSKKSYLENFN